MKTSFKHDVVGQSTVEYALLLAIVISAILAAASPADATRRFLDALAATA